MKRYFSVLLLLLLVGYAAAEEKRYTVAVSDSPSTGPANAPITIIEFLDFQ